MNLLLDGAMDIRRPGHAWPRLSGLSHNRRARAIALHWPGMARACQGGAARPGRLGWASCAELARLVWRGQAGRPARRGLGGRERGEEAARQAAEATL